MKILALDQALVVSGWAVFCDGQLIAANKFEIPKSHRMERRLLDMYKRLTDLYHEYEFEAVYFEDIQLQAGNALTFKHLAYAQAAIIMWCGYMSIPWFTLAPSHWRKVLGGSFGRKRADQKRHAIDLVRDWYGVDVPSDVADAICIGRAAIKEKRAEGENKIAFNDEKD